MELSAEDEVNIFFNTIEKYALTDLEKMLDCVDYNSDIQHLAVPIAQTCFSLLDIVGFLLREDIQEENVVE